MDEKHHSYLTLFVNVTVANLSELLLVYVADFPPGTVIKKSSLMCSIFLQSCVGLQIRLRIHMQSFFPFFFF